MRELYHAVWRVSGREQILLVILALLVAGLASVPLHFQQLAINGLVEDPEPRALAIVMALQQRINQQVRSRVQSLRDVSDRLSGDGLSRIDNAVLTDFQDVFETRRAIFGLKLSSKFALSALSALG